MARRQYCNALDAAPRIFHEGRELFPATAVVARRLLAIGSGGGERRLDEHMKTFSAKVAAVRDASTLRHSPHPVSSFAA